MVGNYKKQKRQLTETQIASIENDLIKSNKTWKEIAQKYGVFEDVIADIAKDMGLIGSDVFESKDYPTVVVTSSVSEPTKRKEKVAITDELKNKILNDILAGLDKKKIIEKYKISSSSYYRIFNKVPKEFIDRFEPTVLFSKIDPDELIEITNDIGSEMYVRLYKSISIPSDSSCKAYLFDDKEKNYVEALKNFKERYLKNQKVDCLTVYVENEVIDLKVSVTLTKWCIDNKTNLIIKPLNKEPVSLITEFSQSSRNFSTFNKRTIGCKKYIYKSTKEKVEKIATIYCVLSFKDVIVTDSIDKALEYLARFEKVCHEDLLKHNLEVFQVNCGNYRQLFKLSKE